MTGGSKRRGRPKSNYTKNKESQSAFKQEIEDLQNQLEKPKPFNNKSLERRFDLLAKKALEMTEGNQYSNSPISEEAIDEFFKIFQNDSSLKYAVLCHNLNHQNTLSKNFLCALNSPDYTKIQDEELADFCRYIQTLELREYIRSLESSINYRNYRGGIPLVDILRALCISERVFYARRRARKDYQQTFIQDPPN